MPERVIPVARGMWCCSFASRDRLTLFLPDLMFLILVVLFYLVRAEAAFRSCSMAPSQLLRSREAAISSRSTGKGTGEKKAPAALNPRC